MGNDNIRDCVPSLTTFVHAGMKEGHEGEVMTNICLSTTFKQSSPGVPIGVFIGLANP